MVSNYLCTIQRARHPFYIESIGINIYSAEELCFYLYHYVYLIDETVINEKLCNWIGEELGMEKEKNLMLRALGHSNDVNAFFLPLFQECRYLSDDELKQLQEKISQIQVESTDVRQKNKADYLLQFELYSSAIAEYERILQKKNSGRLNMQFYAEIMENMATAYARMFCFEEASQYLWRAYQYGGSRKVYGTYLKLLPLFLSQEEYEQKLEALSIDKDEAFQYRKQAEHLLKECQKSALAQRWEDEDEQKLQKLRQEYIRNTTGTR